MINEVVLIGRMTKEVTLRQITPDTVKGRFTLAVDRQQASRQGRQRTDFINCGIIGRGAEILAQYTHKGSQLGVRGALHVHAYDDAEKKRRYYTEVLVSDFNFLEPRRHEVSAEMAAEVAQAAMMTDELPF